MCPITLGRRFKGWSHQPLNPPGYSFSHRLQVLREQFVCSAIFTERASELLDVCRSSCVALSLTFRATLFLIMFQTQRKAPLGQLLTGLTGPMN